MKAADIQRKAKTTVGAIAIAWPSLIDICSGVTKAEGIFDGVVNSGCEA